eukprot:9500007-Pyramimonas_sp.AAC.1
MREGHTPSNTFVTSTILASWGSLGSPLGALLGPLWALLGHLGTIFGHLRAILASAMRIQCSFPGFKASGTRTLSNLRGSVALGTQAL